MDYKRYNLILNGRIFGFPFQCEPLMTPEEVRQQLIKLDGLPSNIVIREA